MMNPKIMIVDDEQSIRDIISEFLTEMDYSVTVAVDGVDALEKIEYEQYDLYIVDVYMPRMDGLELIEKLKQIQPLAVIIVTTGYSSVDIAIKAIRTGAYHYLTKPIHSEDLLKVVKSGLKHAADLGESTSLQSDGTTHIDKPNDILLLRNFTPNQVSDFRSIGIYAEYTPDQLIPMDEETGSMIFVEGGIINVYHNSTVVDTLRNGDVWGEETFLHANAIFTVLKAQNDVQVRHFQRKKLMEYFTYNDEILSKRYMINLIQCQYWKWRKAIYKIGLYSGFSPDLPISSMEIK